MAEDWVGTVTCEAPATASGPGQGRVLVEFEGTAVVGDREVGPRADLRGVAVGGEVATGVGVHLRRPRASAGAVVVPEAQAAGVVLPVAVVVEVVDDAEVLRGVEQVHPERQRERRGSVEPRHVAVVLARVVALVTRPPEVER